MDLSIIIPAYDEAERITPTLRAFAETIQALNLLSEILVVDDGSRDDTAGRVEALRAEVPGLRCLRSTTNRGKGFAVRRGMLAARGALCVMADADGSTPPAFLPKLLAPLRQGRADLAIASRYMPGATVTERQPLYRRIFSRLANRVVQASVLPGIVDPQCGFKALRADVARALFSRSIVDGWSFDIEVLVLARQAGYRIAEVPVQWSDDHRSRVRPLRDLVRVTRELVAIRTRLGPGYVASEMPADAPCRGARVDAP